MPRVHIIATGGTIAMAHDDRAGGAILSLSGEDLIKHLPSSGAALPQITTEEYGPLPSSHFTIDHLWGLRERVVAVMNDSHVDGLVLTHGTDTLEETAYLLDITVAGDKPVVVTGAMRVASQPGYEGAANLIAALTVAASKEARGLGALVVLNDEIHAARDVTKTHTQSPSTFQSPCWGPLGRVQAQGVVITRRVRRHVIACSALEPHVCLLKLAVGMDADLLRQAVSLGARGVVVETFGGGRVPPWWLDAIRYAIAQDVAVAVTSRCAGGELFDPYRYSGAFSDLVKVGCLLAHNLNGQKARLRLMAALGAVRDGLELPEVWQDLA